MEVMSEIREIGWAVKHMRAGFKVARAGWNGKGMWLALTTDGAINAVDGSPLLPFVYMRTAQGPLVPWLCSQTDLLATDWEIAA
jgi:hypothetical protein